MQPHRELYRPIVGTPGDYPERCVLHVAVRARELGLVGHVESLGADLQVFGLFETEHLEQREVERAGSWIVHVKRADVAARQGSGTGYGTGVEPEIGTPATGRRAVGTLARHNGGPA